MDAGDAPVLPRTNEGDDGVQLVAAVSMGLVAGPASSRSGEERRAGRWSSLAIPASSARSVFLRTGGRGWVSEMHQEQGDLRRPKGGGGTFPGTGNRRNGGGGHGGLRRARAAAWRREMKGEERGKVAEEEGYL